MTVKLDTFGTPKRVCFQFAFPRLGFGTSTGLVPPMLLLQSEDIMMLIELLILSLSLQLQQPPFPFMLSTTAKSGKWELGINPFRCAKGVY
jgi:hypothetical protein